MTSRGVNPDAAERARHDLWRDNASHLMWLHVVDAAAPAFTHTTILYENTAARTFIPIIELERAGPSSTNGALHEVLAWWALKFFGVDRPIEIIDGSHLREHHGPSFIVAGRTFELFQTTAPRCETRAIVHGANWGGTKELVSAWRRRVFHEQGKGIEYECVA